MTAPTPKIWFVTGASRALEAGDRVVATARRREALTQTIGPDSDSLLSLALDVTRPEAVLAAVDAALARFDRIDVLVNNAGYGHLSVFEEASPEDAQAQFDTNVFGLMHVTRAVLPVLRAQRSGRIFNVSSVGGLVGGESGTLYCTSKFAVEGFTESLAAEVRRFGIHVTAVEPGFFRTDFLDPSSVRHGSKAIPDYAEAAAALKAFYDGRSHNQAGDPAKLGRALVVLADTPEPPVRWCAGTDAIGMIQGKIDGLQADLDAWRDLSATTDGDFEVAAEPVNTTQWGFEG